MSAHFVNITARDLRARGVNIDMSMRPENVPTIAVVTRVSRPAKYLERALAGLLIQSGAKLHWSIVTQIHLSAEHETCFKKARTHGIKVTITKAEKGLPLGRLANMGVDAVQTDFVFMHDDDDALRPNFIESAMSLFQDKDIAAVTCHAAYIHEGEFGKKLGFVLSPGKGVVNKTALQRDNLFPPIALIYRRNNTLTYPEDVDVAEDWLLNLKLIELGKIAIIPKVCAYAYVRGGAHTNTDHSKHVDMQNKIRDGRMSDRQANSRKLSQRLRRLTDRITYKLGFFLPR